MSGGIRVKETQYDVFLSHNSADKSTVEELARRLVKEGIQPWLDKWNLIPGEPWQEAIEKALQCCATCAVFIGPSGTGPWQNEEMRAAIDRRVSESKGDFRVIPVLLPGAKRGERSRLPTFLVATTWVEFRHTLDDEDAFRRLVCGIRGVEPGPGIGQAIYEGMCPYRGLRFFDVEHAPFFFGREALTEWLLDGLRGDNRFLAIVGPSGSGKSSLARAGLLAALKQGQIESSADWPILISRPAANPLESLAMAFSDVLGIGQDPAAVINLIKSLQENENTLHVTTSLALRSAPSTRRLVILEDQFEELFTLCHDDGMRRTFIDNLLYAANVAQGQTIVLLTLRADFYGKCAVYPRLADALSDHSELVGPMTAEELRLSIERPAQLVGMEFETGLVETLLRDIQNQPGSLPLLQYALLKLWEKRAGRRLTHAAYQDIGRVEGALERHADDVYAALTAPEQKVCQRIFLRLTQPGEGTEDTKRRASFRELLPAEGERETVEKVVRTLAGEEARLIITEGDDTPEGERFIEVAHEALIQSWSQLRNWIEEDRESLRMHRQLTEAAQEWKRHDENEDFLYRGGRLAAMEEWVRAHADDMNPLECEFVEASIALRDREAQEAERRRQRELEQTRRLAEERRKRVLWLSGALTVAVIAAIAAVWFGGQAARNAIVARRERDAAERQSNINYARELKARALVQMDANAECALALAMEAYNQASAIPGFARYEFENVVREALMQTHVQATFTGHTGGVTSVAWSPDGRWLASGDDDTVRIWNTETGKNTATLTGHTGFVLTVAWSPYEQQLVSADGGGTIRLWDLDTGENTAILTGHTDGVRAVAWSPDGRLLASASDDTTVRLWDVRTGENTTTLTGHTDDVYSVAWSPDGHQLASASLDNTIKIWDMSTNEVVANLRNPAGQVVDVKWSPDGHRLASASGDGTTRIWDVDTEENTAALAGHTAMCRSVAWSPDGQWLASASEDSTIRLWNMKTEENVAVLTGHTDIIYGVTWSTDGKRLASTSNDGTMRLWRVDTGESVTIWTASADYVLDAAWSPDGQWLASANTGASYGQIIELWNTDTGKSTSISTDHSSSIIRITWSPDGKRLASASADGTIQLHNADSGDHLITLSGDTGVVYDAMWSPDGQRLASASYDSTVHLWDANTGQNLATLTEHDNVVFNVVWSPDGQRLASASTDETVRLWDANTGENTLVLTDHTAPVVSVGWSPDGEQLASGSSDGTVIVWGANTGNRIAILTGHTAPVWDLAWSPNGDQLASASDDGTVRLWDVVTGEAIATLTGHTGTVRAVTWSPDGRRLASAGMQDHTIIIYYADFQQDVLPIARAQLKRGITPEERIRCLGEP